MEIYFWQKIISPHMANLAVSLAKLGYEVTYVAQNTMSSERAALGWTAPSLANVKLQIAHSNNIVRDLVEKSSIDSIHVCQGVRSNGIVSYAQEALRARGLKQWVVMETVDDSGWRGVFKRLEYRRIFRLRRRYLQGILTVGYRTSNWVAERGMPKHQIFPFSYFLPVENKNDVSLVRKPGPYRFIFVGQLISRKRVDWLINALANIKANPFELWIIGTGADEDQLKLLSEDKLFNQVRWFGKLPLEEVPSIISQADCLVLPSLHDGWGAVASEALMVGTPVVCSDSCGVAGVVRAVGCGGVFDVADFNGLTDILEQQIEQGPVQDHLRRKIIDWSACLTADAGATYMHQILQFTVDKQLTRPIEPWNKAGIST